MYSQKRNYLFDKLPDKDVCATMRFFQQTQFITPVLSSTVKKKWQELQSKKAGSDIPESEDTYICRAMTAKVISFQPL